MQFKRNSEEVQILGFLGSGDICSFWVFSGGGEGILECMRKVNENESIEREVVKMKPIHKQDHYV